MESSRGKHMGQIFRDSSIMERTDDHWWKEYIRMRVTQVRRLKDLEKEHTR
ncbi:MAG: hypothetical protein ABSB79_16040 [Syntrophales bacterium]